MKPPSAKPFSLLPPDLPDALQTETALSSDFFSRVGEADDIEGVRFSGVAFEGLKARRVSFRGCRFENQTRPPRTGGRRV